jgi:hypothetical protein
MTVPLLRFGLELPLVPKEEMTPMDQNLFVKLRDDIEVSDGLTAEDRELLNSLEMMAREVDDEAGSIER